VLLLDTAHHHAQVSGLDDYTDAEGAGHFGDGACNLYGHLFLNLKTSRKNVDQTGDFGQSKNPPTRKVADMAIPKEWQEVMLAQRVELDASDHNHFVEIGFKKCAVDHVLKPRSVAACEKTQSFGGTAGRASQPFALLVLAEQRKHPAVTGNQLHKTWIRGGRGVGQESARDFSGFLF
jgi:hypothetical protein